MSSDFPPVQYYMEIYERSLRNDPFFSAQASTPFATIAIGDTFDPRGVGHPEGGMSRLRVTAIEHIIWTIERSHIGHKLMIVVETAE